MSKISYYGARFFFKLNCKNNSVDLVLSLLQHHIRITKKYKKEKKYLCKD